MHRSALLFVLSMLMAGATDARAGATPVVGPCDGCELALLGMPAVLPMEARIAPVDEPGEPMQLIGTVSDAGARPQAGIIVYAHQTDAVGDYPRTVPPNRHGRLRAWAQTDADGTYSFLTVRPGAYAGRSEPQHIHLHVIEPGCGLYYIDDVVFRDDPRITPAEIRRRRKGRGGSGVVEPIRADGTWRARRDIVLGQGVADYPTCGRGNPGTER